MKVSFLNAEGNAETWEYLGNWWGTENFSQTGARQIIDLSKKDKLDYTVGILKDETKYEKVYASDERKGLIKLSTNEFDTSFGGGYYFKIDNPSKSSSLYVNCKLFVSGFDNTWTNNVLKNSDGVVINNKAVRIINDDLIVSIPPGHTLELVCYFNYVKKITYKDLLDYMLPIGDLKKQADGNSEHITKNTEQINEIRHILYLKDSKVLPDRENVEGWIKDDGTTDTQFNIVHNVYNVENRSRFFVWTKQKGGQGISGHQGIVQYFNGETHLGTALYADESSAPGDYLLALPENCNRILVNKNVSNAPDSYYLSDTGPINSVIGTLEGRISLLSEDLRLQEFEMASCRNRCRKLENTNPFEYKDFDKSLFKFYSITFL